MSQQSGDPSSSNQEEERVSRARESVMLAILSYDELFQDIDNHNRPEGDVRLRHLKLRAIRGNYYDAQVKAKEREYDEFRDNVKGRRLDSSDKVVQEAFEQLMVDVDRVLERSSRAFEQDSMVAKAPVVDPHFMNYLFRWHLERPQASIRAPNGELKTSYGSRGDPVSQNYAAVRGCPDDFFRRLILSRLLVPIDNHIYKPCEKIYNKLFCRTQDQEARGLGGRTLNTIVSALECILSVSCFAGSVILLYNLRSMKDRIIATTFLSLAFPYPIVFLSKEAKSMFPLTAAFWAVMIVFISASNYDMRNDGKIV